jgi:hypothetical protein
MSMKIYFDRGIEEEILNLKSYKKVDMSKKIDKVMFENGCSEKEAESLLRKMLREDPDYFNSV